MFLTAMRANALRPDCGGFRYCSREGRLRSKRWSEYRGSVNLAGEFDDEFLFSAEPALHGPVKCA
jgi:hypothetical protein